VAVGRHFTTPLLGPGAEQSKRRNCAARWGWWASGVHDF